MGAINVHEFMSLDGVIDAPMWTFEYGFDPGMTKVLEALCGRCEGILLGRTTYESFEPAWSNRTAEDDPGAPFFNDTTKYVVSGRSPTPRGATRRSSARMTPMRSAASRTRSTGTSTSAAASRWSGRCSPTGSSQLHLFVYPLTLGAGPRLFPEDAAPSKLSLATAESYDNGVTYLSYKPQA
jgi:dihydrofolate reductase